MLWAHSQNIKIIVTINKILPVLATTGDAGGEASAASPAAEGEDGRRRGPKASGPVARE